MILDQARLALQVGLYDDTLSFAEVRNLLEILGIALVGTAVVVGTGGTAGSLLLLANAAVEGTVAVMYLADGQFADAALGAAFIAIDGAVFADDAIDLIRGFRASGARVPVGTS